MNLGRAVTRLIRRGLSRLLEPTATPEPRYNEAQRRAMAEVEARQQMRIEPLAYSRPKSSDVTAAEVDRLLDFYPPERVANMLARWAAKEPAPE